MDFNEFSERRSEPFTPQAFSYELDVILDAQTDKIPAHTATIAYAAESP